MLLFKRTQLRLQPIFDFSLTNERLSVISVKTKGSFIPAMKTGASSGSRRGSAAAEVEIVQKLRAELATANESIEALESELTKGRKTISRLLADDVRTCEELAELQEMIWGYHRGLPAGCTCDICVEVEQIGRQIGGFIF